MFFSFYCCKLAGLHTVFLTTPHPLSVALTVTVSSLNLIMIQTRDFYISVLNLPVEYLWRRASLLGVQWRVNWIADTSWEYFHISLLVAYWAVFSLYCCKRDSHYRLGLSGFELGSVRFWTRIHDIVRIQSRDSVSTAIELVLKVWWSRLPVGLHTVFLTTPHPIILFILRILLIWSIQLL